MQVPVDPGKPAFTQWGSLPTAFGDPVVLRGQQVEVVDARTGRRRARIDQVGPSGEGRDEIERDRTLPAVSPSISTSVQV